VQAHEEQLVVPDGVEPVSHVGFGRRPTGRGLGVEPGLAPAQTAVVPPQLVIGQELSARDVEADHPDRDAQFHYLNEQARDCLLQGGRRGTRWLGRPPRLTDSELVTLAVAQTATDRPGLLVISDKGFASKEFEADLALRGAVLLRPSFKREKKRNGESLLKSVRQLIESVNDTLKGQLAELPHQPAVLLVVVAAVAQHHVRAPAGRPRRVGLAPVARPGGAGPVG
jgi:hypothetical protein